MSPTPSPTLSPTPSPTPIPTPSVGPAPAPARVPAPAPAPATDKQSPPTYWSSGVHRYMTLYHQTSPEVCASIIADNFHIGRGGLCGKAIYFALSPEVTSTKAITASSHGGCMIEAVVDVGKQGHYYWTGKPQRGEKYCGGWNEMTAQKLHATGDDSIVMRQ